MPVPWRCYVIYILQCDVFQVVVQRWHVVCGVDCDVVLVVVGCVWGIVALVFHFPPSRLWFAPLYVFVWSCNVSVSANLMSTSLWVLSRSCLSLATVFCVSCSCCLSKFFFWQADSTLCWASRSFLNLSNSLPLAYCFQLVYGSYQGWVILMGCWRLRLRWHLVEILSTTQPVAQWCWPLGNKPRTKVRVAC